MSKDTSPTISIIMPTFNHAKELAIMIDSIINSTYRNWELLVVDDGSEEATIHLLQDYARNDYRIRLIRRNRLPKGAPTCRNLGIDEAKGEYVVFFDSDDYITPSCIENRVRAMEACPELDFAVFPSGIYAEGEIVCSPDKNTYGYSIFSNDIKSFASRMLPFIVWNNIYRASSIRKHHLSWDENLLSLQDSDYNITAITCGMKYKYITGHPDYGYRVCSTESISKKICTEKHYKSHLHFINNAYQKIQHAFGHKYDLSLFLGILHIYNSVMTGRGMDSSFSKSILNTIKEYSSGYWLLLKILFNFGLFLSHVMPAKLARQIPMMPFLIFRDYKEWKKVRLIHELQSTKLR